jgi:ParB-like chromosome segregation protein Spo0J
MKIGSAALMLGATLIVSGAVAQDLVGGALGGALRGGVLSRATGGSGSRGAAIGGAAGALGGAAREQQRQEERARQRQLEAERARVRELEMREAERRAEERARADFEAEQRAREAQAAADAAAVQPQVDFRQPAQSSQMDQFLMTADIDMWQQPETWDERARQDIRMIEQRYGPEATISLRQRIEQLQRMRAEMQGP